MPVHFAGVSSHTTYLLVPGLAITGITATMHILPSIGGRLTDDLRPSNDDLRRTEGSLRLFTNIQKQNGKPESPVF